MSSSLSGGSLEAIIKHGSTNYQPVLQVINLKKIASNTGADRYRLLLSDGNVTYSHVMLATQLNHLMENGDVDPLCIIKVNKYLCNMIQQQDKKILILLDINVITKGSDVKQKLGNPMQMRPDGNTVVGFTNADDTVPPSHVSDNRSRTSGQPSINPSLQHNGNIGKIPQVYAGSNFGASRGTLSGTAEMPVTNRAHKIATLTPYQNKWRIKARVSQKSSIRTWSNSRGEGKLFSVNFLDDSSEIRATGFNEEVDRLYDMLEVNKVYYVSRCQLKTANKQYSNLKNDYDMTFGRDSQIERCEDDSELPGVSYDFVAINELEKHPPQSIVDVIGVVKSCGDLGRIVGKQSQKEIMKRELSIVDQSGVAINLTLWGNEAQAFDISSQPVICVKGVRLSDFGGRSLSVLSSSQMTVNPDIREAHLLHGWFDREGRCMDFSSFRGEGSSLGANVNWKTFGQVISENLGQGEKPDYFTAKATIMLAKKDNCMYTACPTDSCNKKVVDQGNGMWRCEKCAKQFPNYKWRMILSMSLADHSGNQWVTSFQESAETILGISSDKLGELKQNNDVAFEKVFQQAQFVDYIFRLRCKVEVYNEESRLRTGVVSATPLDHVEYGKHLLNEVLKMGL